MIKGKKIYPRTDASNIRYKFKEYIRIDNEEDLPRRDVLKNLIIQLDLTNEEIGTYIRKMTNNIA